METLKYEDGDHANHEIYLVKQIEDKASKKWEDDGESY